MRSAEGPYTRGRGPRTVKVLVGLGVALVAIATLVVALSAFARHQRAQQLQTTVDAVYAAARPEADERHLAGDVILTEFLGRVFVAASSVQCVLDRQDAGLVRQGWRLDCTIRTVDVYRTTMPYADLVDLLEQRSTRNRDDPTVLGHAVEMPAPPDGCGTLRAWSGDTALAPSVTITLLQAGTFDPTEHSGGADFGCVAPVPVYDASATRAESTYPDTALDRDQSWVTVERETPFLSHDLGCAPPPALPCCSCRSLFPSCRSHDPPITTASRSCRGRRSAAAGWSQWVLRSAGTPPRT